MNPDIENIYAHYRRPRQSRSDAFPTKDETARKKATQAREIMLPPIYKHIRYTRWAYLFKCFILPPIALISLASMVSPVVVVIVWASQYKIH